MRQVGNGDREKWMELHSASRSDIQFLRLAWGVAKEREDSRITPRL